MATHQTESNQGEIVLTIYACSDWDCIRDGHASHPLSEVTSRGEPDMISKLFARIADWFNREPIDLDARDHR